MAGEKATAMKYRHGERTEQVLTFIRRYIAEMGYPPSIRDIMHGCQFSSTAAVTYHRDKLAWQGLIWIKPGIARGIALVVPLKQEEAP